MKKFNFKIFTANALKIIAVVCMLCDHLWATLLPGNQWLTLAGRIAFPIFTYLIVEGFYHTKDFKKYIKRLFIFALISEIPFNLMIAGNVFFPFYQNVIFSFIISLLLMNSLEKTYKVSKKKFIIKSVLFTILGFLLGTIFLVDYHGFGILMALLFYFSKKLPRKYRMLLELIGMVIINVYLMKGQEIPYFIFDREILVPQQAYALFSLIPIWLYNGKLGKKNKIIQYGFYLIYPLHMLIFSILALYILK